jgi:hypothetical protein
VHDLIPIAAALPGVLSTAEIDATMAYAEAEKAQATREAYASDWQCLGQAREMRQALRYRPLPLLLGRLLVPRSV